MIFAEDLSKKFGDYWAVDGINLNIHPGEILVLIGQNGAGKTTTVRLLTSILVPSRGRATIAGFDVVKDPDKVRSVVGVLTEQHGSYLRMTGTEYLDFFGKIFRLDEPTRIRRRKELLEYFGLENSANQRIGEYSKGMRQKIALARALIHDPPVFLLDEPTSAMDPESAQLVRLAIEKLREQQKTVILCTHNLVEAEALADKVAIIYKGKILVDGTMDELKKKILGPALFDITLRNDWNDLNIDLPCDVEQIYIRKNVSRFKISDPDNTNPRLFRHLINRGGEVVQAKEVHQTLEDIYLTMIKQARDD